MTEEVPQAQVPQASPEPEYNRLFSIFTDRSASSSQLSGLVAYALYKQAKVEWATEQRNKYGRAPTPEELNGYHSSWTTTMVNSVRQQADGALAAFTEDAVSEAEPQVLREALKGKRRRDLVIGITSGYPCRTDLDTAAHPICARAEMGGHRCDQLSPQA